MPHDLDDDDPVVAVGGRVQPVDGLGGDLHRRVEAEGQVGHADILVDGLRQGHDVEALLGQAEGVLLRAAAADADQGVEVMAAVVFADDFGHIHDLAADRHLVRLVATGAEDGPAQGEDGGKAFAVEAHGPVFEEAAETVTKADDVHSAGPQRRLADGPDRRVEPRTVATCRQYADMFIHISACWNEWPQRYVSQVFLHGPLPFFKQTMRPIGRPWHFNACRSRRMRGRAFSASHPLWPSAGSGSRCERSPAPRKRISFCETGKSTA